MRKSIFEVLKERSNYEKELERINKLFSRELFETIEYISFSYLAEEFVDKYLWANWKHRNTCLNTEDMKKELKIHIILRKTCPEIDEICLYLEYVENILYLVYNYMLDSKEIIYLPDYDILKANIKILLDNINHEAHYFKEEQMVLICEKNPAATAVADILKPEQGLQVIRYNHHLMRGDIEAKKEIIISLASQLEPKREELKKIEKKLESHLFYMLNNMNLRHNNTVPTSKTYKEDVARMEKDELEKWYDETYQLLLLAFLLLDNVERMKEIDALKVKIEGKSNEQL